MNPVVHFEMPYDDGDRVARFYEKAFGWSMQQLGPEMGHYVKAAPAETDLSGNPTRAGSINGGFYARKPDWPAQYPSVVIAVDDIRSSMTAVTVAGGKVLGEPTEIPGIGRYVSFSDTENNRVAMLQPVPKAS
ncbi:MAG: VOC family protein [Burkholderiales bacterium]